MKTGNSVPAANDRHGVRVRDDSQLRDIEELVAKLQLVTKQLALPVKPASAASQSQEPSQSQEWPAGLRSEHADSEAT